MNNPPTPQDKTGIKRNDDPRSPYGITSPLGIGQHLMQAMRQSDLYTVNHRGKQFVTCILAVDPETHTLVFDSSQVPEENAALIAAPRSRLQGQSDGIRIEFEISGVRATVFEDRPALKAPFPYVLFYMQRREFFRIGTPVMPPFRCTGTIASPQGDTPFDIEVHDISISGIGLRSPEALEVGTVMPRSQINLQGHGKLQINLRVINCLPIELTNGKPVFHLGCLFENASMAQETMLQRYIMQAEKEHAALLKSKPRH